MIDRPLHILHVETGRFLYGGARQVLLLMKGLRRKGLRNTLICPPGSHIATAAGAYADVRPLPMAGDLDPRLALRLRGRLQRQRPDVIHVHSRRGADYWTPLAARNLDIPLVLSRRVDNAEPGWLVRRKYRPYAAVITISKKIRKILVATGLPSAKIHTVHSAVPSDDRHSLADRAWFRSTFAIPSEAPVIGVVAQLIPRKGHRHLIEALPMVRRAFPDVQTLFFGQGPHEMALRRACREAGLEEAVTFAGLRRDMQRIMPCLDVVVHPAVKEGLGVALLEAAACGRPVVAFPSGGIPEVVHDGVNGCLVPPGNTRQLGRAVCRLLEHPHLADEMGLRGRDVIRRHFSIDSMVEGNLAVYERLAPRQPL